MTEDYQPAERKFQVSRRMLEVCLELGFPVTILSRLPSVLRDLDLLRAINQKAVAVVMFSIISTSDYSGCERVRQMDLRPGTGARRAEALCGHGADSAGRHSQWHVHYAHPSRSVR
jgi:hypothetical protein